MNPAYNAGIRMKDVITHIDGKELSGSGELTEQVENSDGKPIRLRCRRGEETFEVTVTPILSESEGIYKTGIWVRDSGAGTGTLLGNNECGVYGIFGSCPATVSGPLPIALRGEISEGEAFIYCTLDNNEIGKYTIEIRNINRSAAEGKCFTVKVTDEKLLAKTGGIIQGMSGSPIIQNGKLVGAVTHVFINDPTTGYGIFIENMLNQIGDPGE